MTEDCDWLQVPPAALNAEAGQAAAERQAHLTKPPGSLGRLESIAERLAAMQGVSQPMLERVHIAVFAGDHGVVAEGISRFPQAVTAQMVANFANGGAAISVLARHLGASIEVINLGTVAQPPAVAGVQQLNLGPGTANLVREPAMTPAQLERALNAGRQCAERARRGDAQLFIGGEMGIGNTTAAAALACSILDLPPVDLAGPGTGLDANGVRHKAEVIEQALRTHAAVRGEALGSLRCLGGFEIAGLAGAYIAAAQIGLPVLVDGFISTSAALVAERLCPGTADWFLFAHSSAEPGHQRLLEALAAEPLLDLGMRLGEGSGAATAVPLLRLACELHAGMATFAEAGVSGDTR
ncbi:nicotinate-nucleotide--dimethylbenzimidazole phosphoribosyltransferase [Thioalkalivibrio sp. HL-Eb18]|uniref:nicotinate-nucleotide--dimethylbenzimidazole phosphoribosyltransferase n=1 Tax=Thioalkalivibrio sp. HL-Eb18 TaxID=1266913 RepID=UPI00035E0B89|nr:nicotinate-nucleotide--dimethylbenzimidazole phosphoribosyltransferase [Thioalkalivibrio sp. HL-Eb18]